MFPKPAPPPHTLRPPPSLCAVILAPRCGRKFTTGWSEPRLLTLQHSPAALWVTRRLGRLLPHMCPPFPGPAAPTSLASGPSWLTDSGSVIFFSSCLGKARVGASRENPSCGRPHHPRAPPNFLAAGFKAGFKPSHPKNQLVTSKLDTFNGGVTERINRDPAICVFFAERLLPLLSVSSLIGTWLICFMLCAAVGVKGHFGIYDFVSLFLSHRTSFKEQALTPGSQK